MNRVVISYTPDADLVGWLRIDVETPRFKGNGEFWASPSLIKDFADSLSQYPISDENHPELRCGYGQSKVDDVIISLGIKPADALGALKINLNVSDHVDRDSRLQTHFIAHCPNIERFQRQLFSLLAGARDDAVLESS